ncbi:nucleotidyltransferase domain-containing protein [Bacillus sp. YC2]|uniref:nucleotidyltransferase domain-containing protein n=1 Tax=Bacillus sp. YC2 TaxID=2861287 RepID=UPI001CA65F5A|nr:nucleotidyltransferase domain-containing protein [Bacillus sp. YC2]MBY8913464.1 nucleotidyltransferase domain-containing protein [Bacillus sp. YC2]
MKQRIIEELKRIETHFGVKVLYAVESGSRAWGFPSRDSDYDVRFLYVPKKEWYFSIETQRDVIEEPIHDLLDISGWELRKALRLFKKSNPPLLEWLSSDIVYYEAYSAADQLRRLKNRAFSPEASVYHYLNMAKRNVKNELQGSEVKIKKYFYVLRPILACRWIEKFGSVPPMAFSVLADALLTDEKLISEINTLLIRKKSGDELAAEQRNTVIHAFIDEEIERLSQYAKTIKTVKTDITQELNQLLIQTVEEAWR